MPQIRWCLHFCCGYLHSEKDWTAYLYIHSFMKCAFLCRPSFILLSFLFQCGWALREPPPNIRTLHTTTLTHTHTEHENELLSDEKKIARDGALWEINIELETKKTICWERTRFSIRSKWSDSYYNLSIIFSGLFVLDTPDFFWDEEKLMLRWNVTLWTCRRR